MWSTVVWTYGPPYPSCSIVPSHSYPPTYSAPHQPHGHSYYLLSGASQDMCISATFLAGNSPPAPQQCRAVALPPVQWPPPPTLPYLLSPSYPHSCLPTCSSQLSHPSSSHYTFLPPGAPLPPHTWPTPFTSHSDSLHSPFSPAPPHPPSALSLTLNITRSVHILTPFTAPSPLHHRTLPQHPPLRWISPTPSTFWLPSQPLLPCTTAPSLSTLPYAEYHPLRPHSDSLHSPFSPAPPRPPSAHSLTLNITRSVHILTPFTAPSPLHHRTLPQHTPLRWISPTPSTFWLPSQSLLPCTTAPPSTHSLTLNITHSVHILTPFTAPSPLHHRTLPQHTPLRWISPTPSTFWLPSHPLLPCTTAPSLSTLPYAEYHPLRPHSDSLHNPFSPATPHPPSAHSLTLNITRSVHILTPFTAPSPLHHHTLPQHTPLRWISPAPSTFWLPSQSLLPCTTAPSPSTLPYAEYHPLRPHSDSLHIPFSPAPPHPPSAHSLTLNITRSVHILTPFTAPSPLHHHTLPQHTPLRWISPTPSTFWLPSQPLLPCTTTPSLSTLPYTEYHPLRPHSDSLHSPFSPAPPHPPSAHSLTLNITHSVHILTPFTAPSPLHHHTLPQHTPLRGISPAPWSFQLAPHTLDMRLSTY